MGFAASQGRLLMLVARKSDLELKLQLINQQRTYWANVMSQMMQTMAQSPGKFEPGSAAARRVEARQTQVQQVDKMLEMQANNINSQHEAVQTEIQQVRKVISNNIKDSFKLLS